MKTFTFFTFFILFLTFGIKSANSQNADNNEEKNWGLKISGFVKSDYWFDTRLSKGSREELFLFYPLPKSKDANGKDFNERKNFHASLITTRLIGKITGPDAFGAKTSGLIEADFSGVTNDDANGLRLRHSYVKLTWEKSELLIGQTWHPLFTTECYPEIVSLNTGAPFQPFIRNPQIDYTYKFGNFRILAAIVTQRDNTSSGPNRDYDSNPTLAKYKLSSDYLRDAVIPNVHLQLIYKNDHNVAGLAADYKTIQPRRYFYTPSNKKIYTDNNLSTYAFAGYYKYFTTDFNFKIKAIYGQNLTEHLLLGGYAVKSYDSLTGEKYTPTNHLFLWTNAVYGTKLQYGIFIGYAKNLGTTDNTTGVYYNFADIDQNIASMLRIAPSFSVVANKFKISTELEYTSAEYGTADKNDKSKVKNTYNVNNIRGIVTIFYNF